MRTVLLILVFLLSCSKTQVIRFSEGNHRENTPELALTTKNWIAGEIRKSELSKYYESTIDSMDWVKEYGLGTISTKCWMYNDVGMIGGRFRPSLDEWEYTYYIHVNCDTPAIYGNSLFSAGVYDKVRFQIVLDDRIRMWLQKSRGDTVYYHEEKRTTNSKIYRKVKGWHGGTSPAPNDYQYYVVEAKEPYWEIN